MAWFAILVLLAGSSFGVVSTVMKLSYDAGFTVQQVTDGQYVIAMVILWGIVLFWPRGRRLTGRQWLLLTALGIAGAGTSYTYYRALTLLPASMAIVLLFQFSWMVLIIDILVTHKWPSIQKWIGVLLITVGTVLAVGLLEGHMDAFPVWAISLGLLSALFYSATLYLSGYADTTTSPAVRAAVTVTVSTLIICLVFPPTVGTIHAAVRGMWVWGLLSALFSQVIPQMLMFIAIPRTGGRMAGVLGSIELPVAVLVAHVVLSESVSALRWGGVVLILLGIVVSELHLKWRSTNLQRKIV